MIVTYFYGGALVKKKKIQPKQDPNHRIYTIITIKSSSYVLNSFCLDILRLLSYSIVKWFCNSTFSKIDFMLL